MSIPVPWLTRPSPTLSLSSAFLSVMQTTTQTTSLVPACSALTAARPLLVTPSLKPAFLPPTVRLASTSTWLPECAWWGARPGATLSTVSARIFVPGTLLLTSTSRTHQLIYAFSSVRKTLELSVTTQLVPALVSVLLVLTPILLTTVAFRPVQQASLPILPFACAWLVALKIPQT